MGTITEATEGLHSLWGTNLVELAIAEATNAHGARDGDWTFPSPRLGILHAVGGVFVTDTARDL